LRAGDFGYLVAVLDPEVVFRVDEAGTVRVVKFKSTIAVIEGVLV
jgi:hypothetical protein